MIKVIFTRSIPGIKIGQVKDVSDGYALNYLLPQGFAIKATKNKLAEFEQNKSKLEAEDRRQSEQESTLLKTLTGKVVTIVANASTEGTLYAAITPNAIVEAISKQVGVKVTKKNINLSRAIKTTGDHDCEIVLDSDQKTLFTIKVAAANG